LRKGDQLLQVGEFDVTEVFKDLIDSFKKEHGLE